MIPSEDVIRLVAGFPIARLRGPLGTRPLANIFLLAGFRTFRFTSDIAVYICILSSWTCNSLEGHAVEQGSLFEMTLIFLIVYLSREERSLGASKQVKKPGVQDNIMLEMILPQGLGGLLVVRDYAYSQLITGNLVLDMPEFKACCWLFIWYWFVVTAVAAYKQGKGWQPRQYSEIAQLER